MSETGPGMLDRREPMSPRVRVALMAVIGLSFAGAIGMAIFSDKLSRPASAGNDTFSRSAVGHQALVATLKTLEIPVLVSRIRSGQTAGGDRALLVVAEPGDPKSFEEAVEGAEVVLLVLPKRRAVADPERPRWVDSSWLRPAGEVERILELVADGSVERLEVVPAGWDSSLATAPPDADMLQVFRADAESVEPLVVTDDGAILVGEVWASSRTVYVLSDPDLIANHGLHRGDNAVLVIELINQIREHHDLHSVVIDETVHGHRAEASIWQSLFELPIAAATLQAVVALLLGLWAATRGRFGPPADPPGYRSGTEQLVESTAQLLASGDHHGYAVRHFFGIVVREVADRLHTEPAELDAISRRRAREDLAALRGEVSQLAAARRPNPRRLLALAERIHQWREDMIHGPSSS